MQDLTDKLNEKLYDLEYMKTCRICKKNMTHILNNVAYSFVAKFLDQKRDLLFLSKHNNEYYLFTDSWGYSLKTDQLISNLMRSDLDKFDKTFVLIKMNLDYYATKIKQSYLEDKDKNFFNAYVNFMTFYFIFIRAYKRAEYHMKNCNQLDLRPRHLSYYKTIANDPLFAKILDVKKTDYDSKDDILDYRKNELAKDITKYYLYEQVDFFSYYLDSYYVFAKLLTKFLINKNYTDEQILNKIKTIKLKVFKNKRFYDSVICYNNYSYFYLKNKDDKLKYFYDLGSLYGKNYFTKDDIINNYPKYALNILNIQGDLNIR